MARDRTDENGSHTVEWTFGTLLWAMLALFFWFSVAWTFVCVLADILRRDMSGWGKAGWVLLIVFLPFFGALAYLVARPRDPFDIRPVRTAIHDLPGDDIAQATAMRDSGRLSRTEYERIRRQAALRARSV